MTDPKKPILGESQAGAYGAARLAPSLGAADPRARRNAQAALSPDALGAGLAFDQEGRIALKLKESSALGTDDDGFLEMFTDESLEQSPGSRTALRSTFDRVIATLTGGRKRGMDPPRIGLDDITNNAPHEFEGRTLRDVMYRTRYGAIDANARIRVSHTGTLYGTRREINFIKAGDCPVAITLSDDAANERVDITMSSVNTGTGETIVVADTPTIATPILQTPDIDDFTDANHDHTDAAGGGTLDASVIASGTINSARLPAQQPSLFYPQIARPVNATSTLTPATGRTYVMYCGRVREAITSATCKFYIPATAAATITWCEVGFLKGTPTAGSAPSGLTVLGFTDVSGVWNATGRLQSTVTLTGVAAGDHIWAAFGCSATTQPILRATLSDEITTGLSAKTPTRLSLLDGTESWSTTNTSGENVAVVCVGW